MNAASLSKAAWVYLAVVAVLALIVGLLLWVSPLPAAGPAEFLLISLLGALAHSFPVQGARHQAYQVTLPFLIFAAASFSAPQLILFIFLIHVAEQIRLRRAWYVQTFNFCDYLVSAAVAAAIYHRGLSLLTPDPLGQVEAALAAGCMFVLLNRLLLAGALWFGRGLSPLSSGLFKPELLAADLVITWISAPMLLLAILVGPWTIVASAAPLFLARPALAYLLADGQRLAGRAQAPAALRSE
jgi:hypothetical protein